jgi:hypothetical protein
MADPVVSATGISQRIPNGFSPNSPVFQARSEPVRSSGLGGHRDEQRCLRRIGDHGCGAGGGCTNKSENSDPADQGRRLVVEWTADL